MTAAEQILFVGLAALATMITRFLPFLLFSDKRATPAYIRFLGQALPPASFAMLIVYTLRGIDLSAGSRGLPEALAILVTAALYFWRKEMILPVAGGTLVYMALLHFVF